jgi:hypothetical protein
MRTSGAYSSEAVGEGKRAALLPLHVFVILMAQVDMGAAQVSPHTVAPPEQLARDDDRVKVLRQELKKSEEQLESLTRRKAERMAASDLQAVNEAEDQHLRTLSDITALKREIASVSAVAGQSQKSMPVGAQAIQHHPRTGKGTAPSPWWDVYGSGPRAGLPASDSPASTPGQAAHSVSPHSLE